MIGVRGCLLAASLGLVVVVTLWEAETLVSPGELHPSHRDVSELRTGQACDQCHGTGGDTMADACSGCHDEIRAQISVGDGLHGQLPDGGVEACDKCHREHAQGRLALVSDVSFQAAGVGDATRYDHRFTHEFGLTGRHDDVDCVSCHELAKSEALLPQQRRFLGLEQRCVSCHEDPHVGDFGSDCGTCHGQQQPFDRVASYDHVVDFPLEGVHGGHACADCHQRGSGHSVQAVRRGPVEPRTCADCHDSFHREEFLAGVAAITGKPQRRTCRLCHQAEHGAFLGTAAEMPGALHAATGFELLPPHDVQECVACHSQWGTRSSLRDEADPQTAFAEMFPARAPAECQACHGDPHDGQFAGGTTRGTCLSCHDSGHFVPSSFSVAQHDRSRFPLTGAHLAIACNSCHVEVAGGPRFVPTPMACAECHDDVHGGRFDGGDLPDEVEGRVGCARCHETSSFQQTRLTAADHGRWTDYELRGAHAAVLCSDCHRRQQPDERGRTFGRAPRSCAECHQDPHAGQFRVGGKNDCARCHSEQRSFAPLRFDHQRDARFTLDNKHRKLACAKCHKPFPIAGGTAVVRYRPLGTRCEDCHDSRGRGAGR